MQPLDMACEGVAVVNMVHCLFEAVDRRVYLMGLGEEYDIVFSL